MSLVSTIKLYSLKINPNRCAFFCYSQITLQLSLLPFWHSGKLVRSIILDNIGSEQYFCLEVLVLAEMTQ